MSRGQGRTNYEMWKLARRMNQLMDEWMHAKFRGDPDEAWEPAVDMIECERGMCILAELAGMTPDEIKVRVEGSTVTISGVRDLMRIDGQTVVRQMELSRGSFRRTLKLPFEATAEAEISYKDGLLEIRVPKPGHAK